MFRPSSRRTNLIACVLVASVLPLRAQDPSGETSRQPAIQALQDFQVLIGNWRGVGQPKRGSQTGAWQERAESLWELKPKSYGIRWNIDAGKQWKTALFSFDELKKRYTLDVTLSDESSRNYRGKLDDKRLVLETESDERNEVHRVTLTVLNENRVTLLLEKRPEKQSFFTRVAEIGYQRDGTRLAAVGSSGPECVVTGGLGTITVMHKGKTYYVCCSGCQGAFNDDPEGILADFQKRKDQEKSKK